MKLAFHPLTVGDREAVQAYHSAELKTIDGAGHGFYGSQQTQAIGWILDFLNGQEQKAAGGDDPQDDGTTGIRPVTM